MHRFLLAIATAFVVSSSPSHALTLATEDYPPFNSVDSQGKLIGISVEKVNELMRRANEPFTLALYPWSRAYQMALDLRDTCVFSTTRTPEREALFKWVGPLVTNDWVVFARANDTRKPKTLEELRPFVLGGYQNDAVGEFLKIQGFKVDMAATDSENPKKLLHNRFDFWATGELLGHYNIKKSGLTNQIVPLFKFKHTEMHLACHLSMEPQRVERLNKILADMERDGTNTAIERKYK
jgi:polar amino acid transport system substrate-binding protein